MQQCEEGLRSAVSSDPAQTRLGRGPESLAGAGCRQSGGERSFARVRSTPFAAWELAADGLAALPPVAILNPRGSRRSKRRCWQH
jgi:hypothetical protein